MTAGTTGRFNIPSANMPKDKTFSFGANVLSPNITPDKWNYTTGNYFANICFLPFMEVAFRQTLFKTDGKFKEQDRSFVLRLRILKEKKNRPALVIGSNDVLTQYFGVLRTKDEDKNKTRHLGTLYAVCTKNFNTQFGKLQTDLGYGVKSEQAKELVGFFGSITYTPLQCKWINIGIEYDTKRINTGIEIEPLKRLKLYAFSSDFNYVNGGVSYRFVIR